MGPAAITDNPARVAALQAAIRTHWPARVFKTGYRRAFDDHAPEELEAGVLQLLVAEESDFSNNLGMEATEGTLSVALVLHLQVDIADDGTQVQAAELAAGEEIKAFVRAGVTGMGLTLESLVTSTQQETPYGYVVAQINAGPPRDNLT